LRSQITNFKSGNSDNLVVAISALQHVLYCPRQYALIHLEQVWAENRFTAEGRVLHDKAHDGHDESRPGVRITRGLPVSSEEWGLSGVCDVVEFHGRKPNYERIVPIEYKRGKPKVHRADEVQLCAQALCLESMTGLEIPAGYLFYGKTRRRKEVIFDSALRNLVRDYVQEIHCIQDSKTTPPAEYERRKCDACSLQELCQPRINERKRGVKAWFHNAISD
jgi:CRISPR-associated exonuclease Cas4